MSQLSKLNDLRKKITLVSQNKGKIREYTALLKDKIEL